MSATNVQTVGRKVSGVGVSLGLSVVVVIAYISVLGYAKGADNKYMKQFFANPLVESLLAASVAGIMAAAIETFALDSALRETGGLLGLGRPEKRLARFGFRFLIMSVSFMLIMTLTTYLSGRMGGALMCGSRSQLQKEICDSVAAQANAQALQMLNEAGEPIVGAEVVAPVTGSS